jgi:adenine-specific DNA-methyltransferase
MGSRHPQVWGIEINEGAFDSVRANIPECKVVNADFFSTHPGEIPYFNAVIGNPPFIRYQRFNGSSRSSALARAEEAGVRLPRLSSSWAPFLVHAASFLSEGGRLGMVVPAELGHAQYAREVLSFLIRKFGRIQFCIFRRKLFPELSEDTGLLLCDKFGNPCTRFSVAVLTDIREAQGRKYIEYPVDLEALREGRARLSHYLLSPKVRQLYDQLAEDKQVVRLGRVADVGIGYVSGHNDYFHLSAAERRRWRIPASVLRPVLLSMADSEGIVIRRADWEKLKHEGKKVYLLAIPPVRENRLPESVLSYLKEGVELGVPRRFKCRVREPWYSVPHIRVADAFLSYMSGRVPRLVKNRYDLVAPNTLHLVRFDKTACQGAFLSGWYSSLTKLSCELEGHALGGGMLKLEPTEAENVLIPLPWPREAARLLRELDTASRRTREDDLTDLVDLHVLRRRLGLSGTECVRLREAAAEMYLWRMHR